MNTNDMTQEQISAFIDNELTDGHVELVLAALRHADRRATWDVYHQIGDVMRSDQMAHAFSPDFAARMRERLDAEPAIVAPRVKQMIKPIRSERPMLAAGGAAPTRSGASFKRFAIPSAAAAVVAVVLVANPQLRGGTGVSQDTAAPVMAASQSASQPNQASSFAKLASASAQNRHAGKTVADGVIVRDPRIDEYLLAHQRFSPSLYSSAQFARSATFASDSDK